MLRAARHKNPWICHWAMWKSPGGYPIYERPITMSGWWFEPTPLKNDGVRQFG